MLKFLKLYIFFLIAGEFLYSQSKFTATTYYEDPVSKKVHHAYEQSYAILIGIDQYTQTDTRLTSVASVEKFQNILNQKYGFPKANIITLVNDEARLSVINDAFKKIKSLSKLDRVIFYFSGRCYTAYDENNNNLEEGFLIPFDGSLETFEKAKRTCLSLDTLKNLVAKIKAKHSFVLLDVSAGGIPVKERFSTMPPTRTRSEQIFLKNVSQIFVAADRYESVSERVKGDLPIFTQSIFEMLENSTGDKNSDGVISVTEIAGQVIQKVVGTTAGKIHPQFGYLSDNGGDFVFIIPDSTKQSQISFSIKPVDAEIYLDGTLLKDVKDNSRIFIKGVGYHRLEVKRNGYSSVNDEIFVNGRNQILINAELEKLLTADLIIKVNTPGAKVFVNGVFVGQPEKMLMLEGLQKSNYMIRADLDGYFSDSTSISVDRAKKYTANLKLRSKNGFLSVTTSPMVKIYLNKNFIGKEKINRMELPPGQYTLRIAGIGYAPVEKFFVLKDNQIINLEFPLTRANHFGSMWRSVVAPGWGQMYAQRFGWHYPVLQVGTVTAAVVFYIKYDKQNSDYAWLENVYNREKDPVKLKILRDSMTTLGEEVLSGYSRFTAATISATAVYLVNVLDVFLNDPEDDFRRLEQNEMDKEEELKKKKATEQKLSLSHDGFGPKINYTITF